jgi:hypothetical protein
MGTTTASSLYFRENVWSSSMALYSKATRMRKRKLVSTSLDKTSNHNTWRKLGSLD